MTADLLNKTNLYLVGMMGAGKTTIGRKLANRVGYRFVDTDGLIEAVAGKPISKIFADEGEAAFRALESRVLSDVSAFTSLVVATGGGVVTQPMNWSYLHHGLVIWLDVPVPILVSRLLGDKTRPLIQSVDLTAKLEKLLHDRQALYAQADVRIAYESQSIGKICDRITTALTQTIQPDRLQADRLQKAGEIVINQTNINRPVTDVSVEGG